MHSVLELIILFFVYSFLGWGLEIFYASYLTKKLVNRGFLKGPLCPIYGFGSLTIVMIMQLDSKFVHSLSIKLFIAIIAVTLLEYITGVLSEKVLSRRLWDYSDNILNIQGHVCIHFSILWGGLAFLLIRFVHPKIIGLIKLVPTSTNKTLTYIGFIVFLIDIIYSLINNKEEITVKNTENPSSEEKFKEYIEDIVGHDAVKEMKNFCHHRNVSCYDHSLHVAYNSYKICRLLGLDSKSAARGGLLHDFFLYDWKKTRPPEGLHAFSHPSIAFKNANKYFTVNKIEKDCIMRHMWPVTLMPPKYPESIIVCLVDTYCAATEIFFRNRIKIMRIS
ncbi:hypothetical protein SH2C18_42050 [Clostridium sediminicola]|uniref:putative ABC transporter permease n=1 Tax=Clostridium sediminicola TaxID=3114879 RepID=UPI0031F23EA9